MRRGRGPPGSLSSWRSAADCARRSKSSSAESLPGSRAAWPGLSTVRRVRDDRARSTPSWRHDPNRTHPAIRNPHARRRAGAPRPRPRRHSREGVFPAGFPGTTALQDMCFARHSAGGPASGGPWAAGARAPQPTPRPPIRHRVSRTFVPQIPGRRTGALPCSTVSYSFVNPGGVRDLRRCGAVEATAGSGRHLEGGLQRRPPLETGTLLMRWRSLLPAVGSRSAPRGPSHPRR